MSRDHYPANIEFFKVKNKKKLDEDVKYIQS